MHSNLNSFTLALAFILYLPPLLSSLCNLFIFFFFNPSNIQHPNTSSTLLLQHIFYTLNPR